MKTLFLSLLLVVSVVPRRKSTDSTSKTAPSFQAHILTRSEFEELLTKPEQILIIDVRRPDEIKDIGGFPVYLSVQFGELDKSLSWIPKDRKIITVSNHAARGSRAADLLAKNGFTVAGTVGVLIYEEQGGKLTKIVAPVHPSDEKK